MGGGIAESNATNANPIKISLNWKLAELCKSCVEFLIAETDSAVNRETTPKVLESINHTLYAQ